MNTRLIGPAELALLGALILIVVVGILLMTAPTSTNVCVMCVDVEQTNDSTK